MSDIVVKFKPSGQKEIVTAIKAIQAAEKNLTVAGKKHNVVVANMTAKLKAQNKTFKDLGISYATVGKAAKGNRVAMQQLTLAMQQNRKSAAGMLSTNRLLDNSFATMRSHMLLFSFAMSLGIRQTIQFAKQAAKIQDMQRAFTSLSGGTLNAASSISKLRDATDGTLSNFDLLQQANNAMILGVTKNSDEMANMFDMAQRLGNALGVDVNTSIQSLVTGIGRQSRLMLDNIGIIVKSNDAYKTYAREVGKTADTLTDFEKRQAFTEAALEAARNKLKSLNEELPTSNQAFQALSASFKNFQESLGKAALPMIESFAKAMTVIFDAFDTERIKAFATVVGAVLVGAMIKYRAVLISVIKKQTMLGFGVMATAVGFLASELLVLSGVFNDSNDGLDNAKQSLDAFLKEMKGKKVAELKNELTKLESQLSTTTLAQNKNNDSLKLSEENENKLLETTSDLAALVGLKGEVYQNLTDSQDKNNQVVETGVKLYSQEDEELKKSISSIKSYIAAIESGFATYDSFIATQEQILDMYGKTDIAQLANVNSNIANIEKLIEHGKKIGEDEEIMEQYTAVLEFLTNKRIALLDKEKQKELQVAQTKLKVISQTISATGDLIGMSEKNAKGAAAIQAAASLVDAYAAAQSTYAQVSKIAPAPFPQLAYAASLASGLVQARQVAMSANNIGSSSSGGGGGSSVGTGAPVGSFQYGGMVGGRRHSQGGTIIEAEQGEFVMSRNAVESIGLETLNQMNQGGSTGNIVVNVSGNVMTQDFVEGELAEAIKEAARRGSDFGLS